uniref:Replication factor A C-terminal domain-containing protein n=1 Tax=Brassica oleracea TaxID=3712 RepID=A0A3P6GRZ4_BRAOL|nr:unnamed protein product [Brassica oleracea]
MHGENKGWCYVACSKCSRKLQRTVSAFTCDRCANPHAIEALRCPSLCCCVEMAIADDTAEGIFVWFDGVMTKLHNLRATHFENFPAKLVEEGVNPEDTGLPPFIADMEPTLSRSESLRITLQSTIRRSP